MSLLEIQNRLKAPKDLFNEFGGYRYRSCESILNAVKPLLYEFHYAIILTDDVVLIGTRVYVKAAVYLIDETGKIIADARGWAREDEIRKGFDGAQLTGSASSYARKYALNGLLAIDDAKDSDETNKPQPIPEQQKKVPEQKKIPEQEKPPQQERSPKQEIKLITEAQMNAIHAQLGACGLADFRDEFKDYLKYIMLIKDSMKELSRDNASNLIRNFLDYFVGMMVMEAMQDGYITKFKTLGKEKKLKILAKLSTTIKDLDTFNIGNFMEMEEDKLPDIFSLLLKGLSNQEHNRVVDQYEQGKMGVDDAIDVLDGLGMQPKVVNAPTATKQKQKSSFF